MRAVFQLGVLILFIATTDSSIYSDLTGSLSKYLKGPLRVLRDSFQGKDDKEAEPVSRFKVKSNSFSGEKLRSDQKEPKAIIRIFKARDEEKNEELKTRSAKEQSSIRKRFPVLPSVNFDITKSKNKPFRLDHVLNTIRRQDLRRKNTKVGFKRRAQKSSSSADSQSSSLELREWKNEWKEFWIKKKLEALNDTLPQGDVVNMVAARPWGVACGDPNQHDMPWGSCMMPMECEPEYRIYRGDYQCGRSNFVCCAIQMTNYDMYQGFDVSFDRSSLTTDSDEIKNRGKGSLEKNKKKKERERKRRRKERQKRKKKIKTNIKKIIKEIRKILNRQYRNGTSQRKRKTKQLKKFIKDLKRKYKEDRKSVKNIHEIELVKIDSALLNKIREIRGLNENFVTNSTFREIILNGTINKQGARMLVEAYPELLPYFTDKTRRTGGGPDKLKDYTDYDVEYGMLYY